MSREPIFSALGRGSDRNFADTLRGESAGGVALILGTVVALVWANSPWAASYTALRDTVIGPAAWHLDLTLGQWAADGLLAVFFFVVGLELKREFVHGELRRVSTAIVPVAGAIGGMLVPAVLYLALNPGESAHGWAIPTATDIAFAVAVLGIVGRHLPSALRAFLLTLAVVDDLLAILIIAVAYTDGVGYLQLAGAALGVAAFAWLIRRTGPERWLAVPVALLVWGLLHASGVHATIAGVALGLVVPATSDRPDGEGSLAERLEHAWRPVSAGFAVPVFALLAAGVSLSADELVRAFGTPITQGVVVGLVLGKVVGITAATWLVCRFERVRLAPGLGWADVAAVASLGGIGFTVSMLVGELAFGAGTAWDTDAKVGVLAASLIAALVGGVTLALRGRRHAARAAQPNP